MVTKANRAAVPPLSLVNSMYVYMEIVCLFLRLACVLYHALYIVQAALLRHALYDCACCRRSFKTSANVAVCLGDCFSVQIFFPVVRMEAVGGELKSECQQTF